MNSPLRQFGSVALSIAFICNAALAEGIPDATRDTGSEANVDFCRVFGNRAADAKYARQINELAKIKSGIEEQLLVLGQNTRMLEELLQERTRIRDSVSSSLIKIYSNVDAEVAAQQLQKLNTETASEILRRLNPKISGEIISAMDTKFASLLAASMVRDAGKLSKKAENP